MKICPNCRQTYNDNNLNFCLNDGGLLAPYANEEPKTIFMDAPPITNQTNQSAWSQQPSAPPPAPWGGPQNMTPPPVYQPAGVRPPNQTLPIVALVLGIFSILLVCCWGGIPFGGAAVVAGFIAMNQEKSDPMKYGGRGLALAAIMTGTVGILMGLGLVLMAIVGNLR